MQQFLLLFVTLLFSLSLSAQNALNFDGVDDYVTTSNTLVSGNGARTIEAWIKTNAVCLPSLGGHQQIIVDYGTFNGGERFTFNILWNNAIRIELGGGGLSGHIPVNDGVWHHVAVVYDPISSSAPYSLYVDGSLDTAGTISVSANTSSSVPMTIGRRVDGVNNFEGSIDEVRVWNTARTQSELQAYKDVEFCTIPSSLIAYFKMNQGVASGNNANISTLTDASASASNGTLNGFSMSGAASNFINGPLGLSAGIAGTDSIQVTACDSYTSPSGLHTWTSTGIYTDTVPTSNGCDSLITVDLSIIEIDTNVSVTNYTLQSAALASSTFQWVKCDSNYAPIVGATSSSYTATENGNYAVIVSDGICTDTSNCHSIIGIGITDATMQLAFVLKPNPASERVTLSFGMPREDVEVYILSTLGQEVAHFSEKQVHEMEIDLMGLSKGVYYLQVRSEGQSKTSKLVIE